MEGTILHRHGVRADRDAMTPKPAPVWRSRVPGIYHIRTTPIPARPQVQSTLDGSHRQTTLG